MHSPLRSQRRGDVTSSSGPGKHFVQEQHEEQQEEQREEQREEQQEEQHEEL